MEETQLWPSLQATVMLQFKIDFVNLLFSSLSAINFY